jgi:hypothetical protein
MADITVFMKGCLSRYQEKGGYEATKITTGYSNSTGAPYHCLCFYSNEKIGITLHSITVDDLQVLKKVIDDFLEKN